MQVIYYKEVCVIAQGEVECVQLIRNCYFTKIACGYIINESAMKPARYEVATACST